MPKKLCVSTPAKAILSLVVGSLRELAIEKGVCSALKRLSPVGKVYSYLKESKPHGKSVLLLEKINCSPPGVFDKLDSHNIDCFVSPCFEL